MNKHTSQSDTSYHIQGDKSTNIHINCILLLLLHRSNVIDLGISFDTKSSFVDNILCEASKAYMFSICDGIYYDHLYRELS